MNDMYRPADVTGEAHVSGIGKEKAQTPANLLISAAVFGALFSYLFTNQRPGLNIPVFVMLLYAFALINRELFMKRSFREEKLVTLLCLPVLFLAACVGLSGTFLNALGILVILFIIFVQYLVLSDNALYRWYQPLFLVDILLGGINRLLLGVGHFSAGSVNGIFKRQSERRKGVVVGVIAGTAMLVLIIPLLLMADPALAEEVRRLFEKIDIADLFLYIFLFLLGASFAMAPIATANRGEYTGARSAKDFSALRPVQGVTAGVALSMIGAVYILFGTFQFQYFFQPTNTMADMLGLTSSAYAVRGFGELLFVTCLNFIIIAAALRFTKQKDGRMQGGLKALYTVLIAFNFVIMASSHMRLDYYELSYGYTIARFLSHSFMLLLVIFNVIMLIRIYVPRVKLIKFFAIAALVYFCGMVAISPEGFVAHSNVQRFERSGKIDAEYMVSLPGGAVPVACDFFKAHPEAFDEAAKRAAVRKLADYTRLENSDWQSLNAADHGAYLKLKELLKGGK